MGRALPKKIRIIALIAALALVPACQEREQLEKEAPALARADLAVDRIAVAGVVSDVAALGDSDESRESWSFLIGKHLGHDRFGKLPIVSFSEVRAILGRDDYAVVLNRYKDAGLCDSTSLADLHTALEGKARFIVFGRIQQDQVDWSESESETEDEKNKTKTRTRVMTTVRTATVRLRFYDLADRQLVWDHLSVGQSAARKEHDMSDVIEHEKGEGFLGGLVKSIANSAIKPDPKYPPTPAFEKSLANAFDDVGAFLKPKRKK
jgi:hypothetical protein